MLSFSLKKLFIFITLICIILYLSQHIGFQVYYKPAQISKTNFQGPGNISWNDAVNKGLVVNQIDIQIWFNNETIINFSRGNNFLDDFSIYNSLWIKWVREDKDKLPFSAQIFNHNSIVYKKPSNYESE